MKKICLFYFLSLLGLSNIHAQSCIPDITFTGTHSTTYTKSSTWIKSSGITTIPSGADVTWDANPLAGANGYVELNPDFEAVAGSAFLAIVQAVCVGNPLPIKLISFDAKAVENTVQLNWVTSSEINSAGFDIERSENGKDFAKIGFVKSSSNRGTSNENLGYDYLDETPPLGDGATDASGHFYRLKQLDLDGKFEYSTIKFVKIEGKETINIFPNPTSDFVNVETFGQKIKSVELLNTTGSVIYRENNFVEKIDLSGKTTGIYFLRIEKMDGKVIVKKILKK